MFPLLVCPCGAGFGGPARVLPKPLGSIEWLHGVWVPKSQPVTPSPSPSLPSTCWRGSKKGRWVPPATNTTYRAGNQGQGVSSGPGMDTT